MEITVISRTELTVFTISVDNWDILENVLNYTYKRHIQSESQEHPVMMSEASVCSNHWSLFNILREQMFFSEVKILNGYAAFLSGLCGFNFHKAESKGCHIDGHLISFELFIY